MGHKSYDRSLAWRIIYLMLGANAGTSPLMPIQVAEHMEAEHTPVGIKYTSVLATREARMIPPHTCGIIGHSLYNVLYIRTTIERDT